MRWMICAHTTKTCSCNKLKITILTGIYCQASGHFPLHIAVLFSFPQIFLSLSWLVLFLRLLVWPVSTVCPQQIHCMLSLTAVCIHVCHLNCALLTLVVIDNVDVLMVCRASHPHDVLFVRLACILH